ncbi:MAG: ATP-binding protein [Desulfobacterales bacterium]|nr:ATP-binding protein [Desulfobacterales bacterium]
MHQQIRHVLFSIVGIGLLTMVLGIWMADLAARRVTRPLGTLVDVTVEAAKGNLEQDIAIHTRDEVEILASNFSVMIREILSQQGQLENQVIEINTLRKYAEKILATMNDGLLAVDMEGRVTSVNPAAQSILGVAGDQDILNASIDEYLDAAPPLISYFKKLLKEPTQKKAHEIRLEVAGDTRYILVGVGVLLNGENDPSEVIFTLNDITELRALEAEIRQGQRLADLGVLAAGMAHEIRNPLSAIKTYVALLPQKIEKPGFLDKFQRTVPREINRLNSLIEELLELSRPPKYNFQAMDIGLVLRQNTELLEPGFRDRNIHCNWEIPTDLPPIEADANQLEKVFINLLQNGAQAMGEGGELALTAQVEEGQICVAVKDTGKGMDKDVVENIFTPFFTTKAKGTGLGLAISHKVISEHGGQIVVTSKKGEGSCFSVRLPVTA